MKEKVKCKKCGLFIDSDCQTCPYCGYPQNSELEKEDKASKNIENLIKDIQTTMSFDLAKQLFD